MNTAIFRATILIVVSAACFSSAIVAPCLPFIAQYFDVPNSKTSLLVSIFLFGYLSGQVAYSIISQKFGYRFALILGFSIYILSCIAQISAIQHHSFNLLFYSRFLCAFGASSGLICVFALINELSQCKEQTQKLISLAFISLTLFAYLSITLSGLIIQYFNWIFVFYIMILISLIQFTLIYKYIPNIKRQHHVLKTIFSRYLHSIRNYKLLMSSLIVAFTTTSTYLYNAMASTISTQIFLLSPSVFGMIAILNLLALILGGCISLRCVKRYSVSNVLLSSLVLASIPIGGLLLFHEMIFSPGGNGVLFFSAVCFLNFSLGLIYPTASYFALNAIDCSATASSIMNFIKIACPACIIWLVSQLQLELAARPCRHEE